MSNILNMLKKMKTKIIGTVMMLPLLSLAIYILLSASFWKIALISVVSGILFYLGLVMFRSKTLKEFKTKIKEDLMEWKDFDSDYLNF